MSTDKPFYKDLRCELTDLEVSDRARELAESIHERAKTEEAKAAAVSAFGATLKAQAREAAGLAREVRERATIRAVECKQAPDYKAGIVETVRLDTGEVVGRRPLEPGERQPTLLPSAEQS